MFEKIQEGPQEPPSLTGDSNVSASLVGARAALSSLRSELAFAQRRDPTLLPIIKKLEGMPMKSFLMEPRGSEGRKVAARVCKFALAADGVLLSS